MVGTTTRWPQVSVGEYKACSITMSDSRSIWQKIKKTPSYDYDYSFLHDTIHIFELEHNLTLSLNFNYTPVKFRDCTARWWHFHIDQKVSTERRTTYIHLEKSSKSPLCWFLNEPVPRTTFCHYDTHTTRKHRLTKWNISSWRCHGWYQ